MLNYGKVEKEYGKLFENVDLRKSEFFSNSPPSVFIGRFGYPNVNVGILTPPEKVEDSWMYDSHTEWAKQNKTISEILRYRSNLVNSRFKAPVLSARGSNKFLEMSQEIGMAKKQVDVELELKKKIKLEFKNDPVALPMGPRGALKQLRITENTKIDRKVDKVVDDYDLKSAEALKYLYKNKFDEKVLYQLLSIGVLGLKKNRKLVPTRWSITASHSIVCNFLVDKIKKYETIDKYMVYFGKFLGNYYVILLFPEVFSYELFESYLPGSSWNPGNELKVSTDYESYDGRKKYVDETAGGYFAAKISIVEELERMGRQASVLAFRFETPEYWAGLGVWVVKESTKRTMVSEPRRFETRDEAINFSRALVLKNFKFDINSLLKKSKLWNRIKTQRKLLEFV
jgi:DNA repair protein NreA